MFKKLLKNQSGAVLSIEFAVILPLFLLLIFMFIEFCRLLFVSSVLDVITVEGGYFVAKTKEESNYSQLFYDKVSDDIPIWPLITSSSHLKVEIVYCSLVDDAINFTKNGGGNCYTSPINHSLAVFSVEYQYSPMFSNSLFSSFKSVLERKVVVFKEY
ncbi:TadE/TadG family type IV pilus assembly protein [Zophobihabitans entericus]|uniref:TadE-like domain-containing protein n=1 Tax=Zophobihabitans entericus TaxID=1635327 RepID=A0A6G9IAQ9_9GAMM|nr:TadE/TadG family type IV pilus assembly protein [Zophobihabitans entericus]QIQ21311.1 hypothetical protein IPMB12_06195 [Zophobihabitans entericus]